MRFLQFNTHPPKNRLVRQEHSTADHEWRKFGYKRVHHTSNRVENWNPPHVVFVFMVVLLLIVLFMLFGSISPT